MVFPLVPFVLVAYFTLYAFAYSIPSILRPSQSVFREQQHLEKASSQLSFTSWLQSQEIIALDNLLKNVAPGGSNAPDAAPGSVIASPSKQHPNYYYQCTICPTF